MNRFLFVFVLGFLVFFISSALLMHFVVDVENGIFLRALACGLLFGLFLVMVFFAAQKKLDAEREFEGHEILMKSFANHKAEKKSIGGKLYMTEKILAFRDNGSHDVTYDLDLQFNAISNVKTYKTLKFLHNGLEISLKNGNEIRLIVWENELWLQKLQEKLNQS